MISAKRVEEILVDCLFKDGESTDEAVIVHGIINYFGFHPGRLAGYKDEVEAMLIQLPQAFRKTEHGGGGGWSFLQACMDVEDNHWGEHINMDQLFCLGLGLELVTELMPREVWGALPGGMPYYRVEV